MVRVGACARLVRLGCTLMSSGCAPRLAKYRYQHDENAALEQRNRGLTIGICKTERPEDLTAPHRPRPERRKPLPGPGMGAEGGFQAVRHEGLEPPTYWV